MEWARSNTARAIAVIALTVFIVVRAAAGDGAWVIVGAVLLVFNLLLWRSYRAERRMPAPPYSLAPPYGQAPQAGPSVGLEDVEPHTDVLLSELLDRPEVAAAWATGPARWRQVSYLDDDGLELPAAEVADYVWILVQDAGSVRVGDAHWSIGLGEEMKPLLDLDVDEDADPLIATLLAHPSVDEAFHSDREEYEVVLGAAMTLDEMAALAARGLIAHHQDAVRRLLG